VFLFLKDVECIFELLTNNVYCIMGWFGEHRMSESGVATAFKVKIDYTNRV
jgi:hypothetical protein